MEELNEKQLTNSLMELVEKQKEINEYILKTKRLGEDNDKL